jgi:hypothetical protein
VWSSGLVCTPFIDKFGGKLKTENVFDTDWDNDSTLLSAEKSNICRELVFTNRCSRQHARVCGVIVCYFMLTYIRGKNQLLNIDFLHEQVESLTPIKKLILSKVACSSIKTFSPFYITGFYVFTPFNSRQV